MNQTNRRDLKKWLVPIAIVAILIVAVLAIRVAQTLTTLVISCSPVAGSIAKPPASLSTAQDYFAQGDYEFDQGHCDAAITAYGRAVQLNPNFAEAYNNRAYTYMVKKDYASALPDLDRAIQLRPNYVNALMNRGDIYNYYFKIDYDRAIADYQRVLALGSEAYQHTSLCGHLMLATHHGWSPGVFQDLFTSGFDAGCAKAVKTNP